MKIEFKIEIVLEEGDVVVDCDLDGKTIGFHWTPARRRNPYLNGGIDPNNIEEDAAKMVNDARVWIPIKDKPEMIKIVSKLAKDVYLLARITPSNRRFYARINKKRQTIS